MSAEKILRNDTVRRLYCAGFKQFQIAMQVNLSACRVQQILHGQWRYRHDPVTGSHPRCQRCHKTPRSKAAWVNWGRYTPYCSFHCQEWGRLDDAQEYLRRKRTELL
jgi:hypothetical protein